MITVVINTHKCSSDSEIYTVNKEFKDYKWKFGCSKLNIKTMKVIFSNTIIRRIVLESVTKNLKDGIFVDLVPLWDIYRMTNDNHGKLTSDWIDLLFSHKLYEHVHKGNVNIWEGWRYI